MKSSANNLKFSIFSLFSILLLVYMLWPGPSQISDFPALSDSTKSTLEGDTIQIPNVAGYFSNNYREFSTDYYKDNYRELSYLPISPIKLNHPPEYAWKVIKVNTDSTYLEEFVYPLRDSLYINGFEPFYEDGSPKFWGAIPFDINSKNYFTKVTLRFYQSELLTRFIVWFGIIVSIFLLFKLGRRIVLEKND
jgi:hypothetical protein